MGEGLRASREPQGRLGSAGQTGRLGFPYPESFPGVRRCGELPWALDVRNLP